MKKTVFLIATLAITSQAFAGSTNVFLKCDSPKKTIHLEAGFPGDEAEAFVTVKTPAGTKSYINQITVDEAKMNSQDLNKDYPGGYEVQDIVGIDRTDIKVLTLAVLKNGSIAVELAAVPESIKLTKGANRGHKGTFTGKLNIFGQTIDEKTIRTTVTCDYDYSI